jgi:MFS family permease
VTTLDAPTVAAPPRRLSGAAAVVLALGALDFGLEQSIIVPALPALAAHYDTSIAGATWLGAAFILAAAVAVPLCGRLGDLVGKKRMILVSLALFAVGSVVCAVSTSIGLAVAGRVIQGLGAAVVPLALGLARDTVSRSELPKVIGIVAGAGSVGAALGFLLSGVLVDAFSPPAIFWFLGGAGAVLGIAVAVVAPESPLRARVSLDIPGTALLGLGLGSFLIALSQGEPKGWVSAPVLTLVAVSAVALALFWTTESRRANPLVDLALLRTRPFVNVDVVSFAFGFAFFIGAFLVPQLAAGLDHSVTEIGLILAPTAFAGMLGGWTGGRLVDRIGARAQVTLGALIGVVGYVSLATTHGTVYALGFGSALIGIGWGLIPTGYLPVVLRSADVNKTSIAASVVLVLRNVGVSFGITIAVSVAIEVGYTQAFVFGAVACAAVGVLAAWLPGRGSAR